MVHHTIQAAGLRSFVRRKPCEEVVYALFDALTAWAVEVLPLFLPDSGEIVVGDVEEQTIREGWPRGFDLRRKVKLCGTRAHARVVCSYLYENPRDGAGYFCSVEVWDVGLEVRKAATLSLKNHCSGCRPIALTFSDLIVQGVAVSVVDSAEKIFTTP